MLKIIHICSDEKFIDSTIKQFDLLKGIESTFCAQTKLPAFKFIKNPIVKRFSEPSDIIDFANKDNFDIAVLHSLCYKPKILNQLKIPIFWASWGFDIYSDYGDFIQKPLSLSLYKPLSKKFAENYPKTFHDKLSVFLRKFGILSNRQKEFNALINKISYISVVLPTEFEMIKTKYPHLKRFDFHYKAPNPQKDSQPSQISNKILLGNSLNPTNNHLDILNALEKKKIKCEVYLPISYPDNYTAYKNELKSFASQLKYVTAHFIEDFMPKQEYFNIIDQCGVAIFGHIRQQAIGNIRHMLLEGKKVLLYSNSIAYKYYSSYNLKLFSIENDLDQSLFQAALPIEDQERNFQFFQKKDNYELYIEELQRFFDNLTIK